jgi:hypothetical protein
MRRPVGLVTAALLGLGACGESSVRIAYRPPEGATYEYRIDVESSTRTVIDGRSPRTAENEFSLDARHRVESTDEDSSEVRIELRTGGGPPRELLVRLDRAAQLTEVVEVEGLPAEVLGELGLSEIFPAAAAAPPVGSLRPGSTWEIDAPVQVTGSPRERLQGSGRLAELDVRDGREVAVVVSAYRLPVSRTTEGADADRIIDGTQTTRSTTTYDLADGSVLAAESVTTGEFTITLTPPGDPDGPRLSGRLEVEVRSRTERD